MLLIEKLIFLWKVFMWRGSEKHLKVIFSSKSLVTLHKKEKQEGENLIFEVSILVASKNVNF